MLIRAIFEASLLAGLWWYGRWLFQPSSELPFDQSILLSGTIVILFIAHATLTMTLLTKLADRWSGGVLEGKSAEVARLLLSFSSLLFLGTFLLLSMADPMMGVVSIFSVSFLYGVLRGIINGRLRSPKSSVW
jgi:hypothetical protein